jgi:hypothetical protein
MEGRYSETIDALFSSLKSSFIGPQAADGFFSLTPSQPRNCNRRIAISWKVLLGIYPPETLKKRHGLYNISEELSSWEDFWKVIATIYKLLEIHISIYYCQTIAREDAYSLP